MEPRGDNSSAIYPRRETANQLRFPDSRSVPEVLARAPAKTRGADVTPSLSFRLLSYSIARVSRIFAVLSAMPIITLFRAHYAHCGPLSFSNDGRADETRVYART